MNEIKGISVKRNNRKIYFIYNFRQVLDFITIVMYNDKLDKWCHFTVYYVDGKWETDVLSECTNDKIFMQICRTMELIAENHLNPQSQSISGNNSISEEEAAFLLDIVK
jgi:hypothetical protein